MERLRNMGLKQTFFLLSAGCLCAALLLTLSVYGLCGALAEQYPQGGVSIDFNGLVTELPDPTPEQQRILDVLDGVRLAAVLVLPAVGLAAAGFLFYRWKLKKPVQVLRAGTERIRNHDLDFSIPEVSGDELGQICAAFETMRAELLETSQELWRQAEERKRLNAAFSHDLRNPVTVLKGSVLLLKQGKADGQVLDRMERYILRLEQYVEAMSSIQRLEQMPVRTGPVDGKVLRSELEETARLLAPGVEPALAVPDLGTLCMDHGLFLTTAENLIGNAARFARGKLELRLALSAGVLSLTVMDDGPGFPESLLESGPKPFGKAEDSAEHFGMGLYSSDLMCRKHGGALQLTNRPEGGAAVTASFRTDFQS